MLQKHPWIRAYAGGLLGTAIFVWLMYVSQLQQLDFASALVKVLFGYLPSGSSAFWYTGYYYVFILGAMLLPWVYSRVLNRFFTAYPVINGVTIGVVLWAIQELVMVPCAGLGDSYLGLSYGTKMVLASLLTHVAYGVTLCVVAGRAFAIRPAAVIVR